MYYFWMFLGFSIFVGVYWYLYLKGQEDYYNHIEKKSQRRYICKRFHNAYLAYWGKPDLANSVFKKYSKTILSDDCLQWTDREWKILEDDLKDRERKKRLEEHRNKLDEKYKIDKKDRERFVNSIMKKIMNDYPNGYAEYKKRNPESTMYDVVYDMTTIVEFESKYNK